MRSAWLLPAIAVIALVLVIGMGFGSGLAGGSSGTPTIQPGAAGAVSPAGPAGSPGAAGAAGLAAPSSPGTSAPAPASSPPGVNADASAAASEGPAVSVAAPAVSAGPATIAIVPVTNFRSGRVATKAAEVAGIATGASPYGGLVLVQADADGILAALQLSRAALGAHLTTVATPAALAASLALHRTWLGVLRADEVVPSVRALAWGTKALFGEGRVATLAAWPLTATPPLPPGRHGLRPGGRLDPLRGRRPRTRPGRCGRDAPEQARA